MVASRWFDVITRGLETTSPRPSFCSAESSEIKQVVGAEDRETDRTSRLATGRLTFSRSEPRPAPMPASGGRPVSRLSSAAPAMLDAAPSEPEVPMMVLLPS